VKAFIRAFCLALVTVGVLGVTGCGPDNETEVQKLAPKVGDPGKPNAGSMPEKTEAPPKTAAERAKRGPQGGQKALQQSGYPGATTK